MKANVSSNIGFAPVKFEVLLETPEEVMGLLGLLNYATSDFATSTRFEDVAMCACWDDPEKRKIGLVLQKMGNELFDRLYAHTAQARAALEEQ